MFGQPNNAAALVDFYGRRQLFSESLHAELAAVPRDELDFPSNHTRQLLDRMKVCKPSHILLLCLYRDSSVSMPGFVRHTHKIVSL